MAESVPLSAREIRSARAETPKLRARDMADRLGISEGELVAAHLGHGVTRIDAAPAAVIGAAERLGPVMALTRTSSCVHEKVGTYANFRAGEHAAMVLAEDIDLRIFPRFWVHAFAVEEPGEERPRRSIQVFDAAGDAVHKIHLRAESNHDLWDEIVAGLAHPEPVAPLIAEPRSPVEAPRERPDRAAELRQEWDRMTDTHQFLALVARQKMNRLGAYRVAGAPYARPLAPAAVQVLLERLTGTDTAIMIFVGNAGCIQIHSGPIRSLTPMGPWLNVLDPGFNLHLRGDHVAEVWAVEKPTRRGTALSVEAFDDRGGLILQIFAVRKPGDDHGAAFAALVAELPELVAVPA